MKNFFLVMVAIFSFFNAASQRNYTKQELERLRDLGRLWGMVNYFHPAMGTGKMITDSLIINNAASLATDPSAQNFTRVVANMLGQLKDPSTRIKQTEAKDSALLFSPDPITAAVKKFANGKWYIALPTVAVDNPVTETVPYLMPEEWDSAQGIVLDLRNRTIGAFSDYSFLYQMFGPVRTKLGGKDPLPPVYERSIYHNGLVPQNDGTSNIYFSGWRTATKGSAPPATGANVTAFNKPFAFVVNKNTSAELLKALLPLRATGRALIIFEGAADDVKTGWMIDVPIADKQVVSLKAGESFIGDAPAPQPDVFVNKISDVSDTSAFLKQCFALLDNWSAAIAPKPMLDARPSQSYTIPKPAAYANNMAPPLGQRLFGLYNFWNAIQYFYPYKNLLSDSWDNQLTGHLANFIAATDGVLYALAMRKIVAEIHDSHGFINNVNSRTPIREVYGYWPPVQVAFINNKLYIVDIGKDSLQNLGQVQLWDEIITINGVPVAKAAEGWRSYFATSNESTFMRDLPRYIINGPLNTTVALGVLRNGNKMSITLKRTGRNNAINNNKVDFNDDYPVLKKLDGNIGYVNMGNLTSVQVDSMFTTMMATKAIIFDMRNYPNGTAWSIAPRLAKHSNKSAMFNAPLVTADYIEGGEGKQEVVSYFTVEPDTTRPQYKGKVVVLCNEQSQSQAEYSIMMFQAATDVTVIGSQTAGADGNVTNVVWPGGYITSFSGTAILYPDGTQTQRKGIRINITVKPTLAALKAGKDEVLERAIQWLKTGK